MPDDQPKNTPSWGGLVLRFLALWVASNGFASFIGGAMAYGVGHIHVVIRLSFIPIYESGIHELLSTGIVSFAAFLLFRVATWAMKQFPWSQNTWLTGLMLETARWTLLAVPFAWVIMAAFLPWASPVVLAAAFMVPLAVALLHGLGVLLFYRGNDKKLLMVQTLLSSGETNQSPDLLNDLDASYCSRILSLAIKKGHTDIATRIVNDHWKVIDHVVKYEAYFDAVCAGDLALVQKFVSMAGDDSVIKQTLFQYATTYYRFHNGFNWGDPVRPGSIETIRYLLTTGVEVDSSSRDRDTIWLPSDTVVNHLAWSDTALWQAVMHGDDECAAALLKGGANMHVGARTDANFPPDDAMEDTCRTYRVRDQVFYVQNAKDGGYTRSPYLLAKENSNHAMLNLFHEHAGVKGAPIAERANPADAGAPPLYAYVPADRVSDAAINADTAPAPTGI